jgi:hypothetical protein
MSGYANLRGRITLALSRCQEQPWLDFKESQPWPELRWRILKTIMGMANLRDGGLILIGVAERGTTWELTGIDTDHLTTFDYDNVIDQLGKYASPQVNMDIVVHDHDDGKRYLAFHVYQFSDAPVVCRNNSPDDVKPKDRLAAGEVYVRSTTGSPRTMKVTDAARLHDLLELAAEFRARRMLEVGKRVGLVPGETAPSRYDAELGPVETPPDLMKGLPFWRIVFRPEEYVPDLIPSLTECLKLIEKTRVQLRGWDFPHLPSKDNERLHGSNWIGAEVAFLGSVESWRLFQSGQFVHFAAVRETTETAWREKLQQAAMSHLHGRQEVDWDAVPGYISLVNLVYIVSEAFEFAARVCQAGVYRGSIDILIELNGIKGFVLTPEWGRGWSGFRRATEDHLGKNWRVQSNDLIAGSADHSLKAIAWLCECFGWMSPNLEAIRKDQEKLLKGMF